MITRKQIIEEAFAMIDAPIQLTDEQKKNALDWLEWAKSESHMIGQTVSFELCPRYLSIDQSLLPEHNRG